MRCGLKLVLIFPKSISMFFDCKESKVLANGVVLLSLSICRVGICTYGMVYLYGCLYMWVKCSVFYAGASDLF